MRAADALIEASALRNWSGAPSVVFDCRHQLTDPAAGRRAYAQGHIPGAQFAHLDEDLAGPAGPGGGGRHPLPDRARCAEWLGRCGVGDGVQVVVYDDMGGAMAARLWWMLRWLGHESAAVLDGGMAAWAAAGGALESTAPTVTPRAFEARESAFAVVDVQRVESSLSEGGLCLVDARDAARWRGDHEPFAPVAGHIPGALSRPFADNLDAEGRFRSADQLRARFETVANGGSTAFYCGSGVTACHNILAWCVAGLEPPVPALYTGSWSEWVLDETRPVETA